jgi:streptogramin lyase
MISMPSAVVLTLAGAYNTFALVDGIGTFARFYAPAGIAINSVGNLIIADYNNHAIRMILSSTMEVVTIAGSYPTAATGSATSNGIGTYSGFASPIGVYINNNGDIYIADRDNNAIRKISILQQPSSQPSSEPSM